MKQFSLGDAWRLGTTFFSGKGVGHAIILIGIGILAPFALQVLLIGQAMGTLNPALMGQGGVQALADAGGAIVIASLLSYVLQLGSYFGSWRLGFGADESLAGAIVYGLIVAAVVVVGIIVLVFVLALVGGFAAQGAGAGGAVGVGVVLALLILIPLFVLIAVLVPLLAAAVCVMMFLIMLIAISFGVSAIGQNPALSTLGGGAIGFVIILALTVLLFWLVARLCCAAPAMARRKAYNLLGAMGESWRLTAANQGRIMLYFLLLGIVGMVVLFVLAMVVGASMMGSLQSGAVPQVGMSAAIAGLIIGIPLAYALVLVPAGIYRELDNVTDAEKVFA